MLTLTIRYSATMALTQLKLTSPSFGSPLVVSISTSALVNRLPALPCLPTHFASATHPPLSFLLCGFFPPRFEAAGEARGCRDSIFSLSLLAFSSTAGAGTRGQIFFERDTLSSLSGRFGAKANGNPFIRPCFLQTLQSIMYLLDSCIAIIQHESCSCDWPPPRTGLT